MNLKFITAFNLAWQKYFLILNKQILSDHILKIIILYLLLVFLFLHLLSRGSYLEHPCP